MKTHFRLTFLISTIALLVLGAPLFAQNDVWVGNSPTTSNWSDGANWQSGTTPMNGDLLLFQGVNRTTNTNDLSRADYESFTFDATAGAFDLQGRTIGLLSGGLTNNSSNAQTISFSVQNPLIPAFSGLAVVEDQTWLAASGGLNIFCNVEAARANTVGPTTLTVAGAFQTTITGSVADDPTNAANTLILVKAGAGTLTLSNANTYTGGTTVNGGVLAAGNLNALGAGNVVVNGGTLQTANGPRPITVGGSYTQFNGGTLRLLIGGIDSGAESDFLTVNGLASVNGTLAIIRTNGYNPMNGDHVDIIGGPGGRTGAFSNVTSTFSGLLQPMPMYDDPNDIYIVFQISSFNVGGLTPNQLAVAHELNEEKNDPRANDLVNFLALEPLGNLPRDYDLIAPEELASVYEIGFSQAVVQNMNLQHRMDDIRAGSNGFCSSGYQAPQTAGYSKGSDGKGTLDQNPTPALVPSAENRWGVFVTGSGDFVNVGNRDENAHGYDITTGNVTVGADYRLCDHFAIGIDGGYSGSTADLVDGGRVEVDGGKAGAYATLYGYKILGSLVHVDGAVSGGWNSFDTRRTGLDRVTVLTYNDIARGSTNGSEFNALLAYGGDWHFGCLLVGTWSSIQYTNVGIDRFTETGSFAPLQIQNQDQYSLRGTSGVRVAYDLKCGRTIFRPEVRAAWQHESGDRAYPIDARFASGAGDVFTVHGPAIGRDSALVDAGFAVQWSPRCSSYVYYDGVLGRSNYDNNAVSGGFRVSF